MAATLGTIVVLNSGGPRMTIVETKEDQVRCEWQDEGKTQSRWFLLECITVMVKIVRDGKTQWVKESEVSKFVIAKSVTKIEELAVNVIPQAVSANVVPAEEKVEIYQPTETDRRFLASRTFHDVEYSVMDAETKTFFEANKDNQDVVKRCVDGDSFRPFLQIKGKNYCLETLVDGENLKQSDEYDQDQFRMMIEEHPGEEKIFKCKRCKKEYHTDSTVPPAILCPGCGNPVLLEAVDRSPVPKDNKNQA